MICIDLFASTTTLLQLTHLHMYMHVEHRLLAQRMKSWVRASSLSCSNQSGEQCYEVIRQLALCNYLATDEDQPQSSRKAFVSPIEKSSSAMCGLNRSQRTQVQLHKRMSLLWPFKNLFISYTLCSIQPTVESKRTAAQFPVLRARYARSLLRRCLKPSRVCFHLIAYCADCSCFDLRHLLNEQHRQIITVYN